MAKCVAIIDGSEFAGLDGVVQAEMIVCATLDGIHVGPVVQGRLNGVACIFCRVMLPICAKNLFGKCRVHFL